MKNHDCLERIKLINMHDCVIMEKNKNFRYANNVIGGWKLDQDNISFHIIIRPGIAWGNMLRSEGGYKEMSVEL